MKLTEIKTNQYVDLTKVEAVNVEKANNEFFVVIYLTDNKFVSSRHLEERSAVQEQCRLVELIENEKGN